MSLKVRASVTLLLAALAVQTALSMRTKSPTVDEYAHHIANGYSYLVTGDFRMNPASPPLPRLLAAVPLWFLGAKAPVDHPSFRDIDSPEFARQFFNVYNAGRQDELVFWARVPILLVSLLFGLAVFLWSRRLSGDAGGLASLALYVFSPNIIAHSGLATADLSVAFFMFLALIAFWAYLRDPSPPRLVLCALASGAALLSKFSAVLIFPMLFLIALASGKAALIRPKRTLAYLAVCFLTVWAGYFFEVKPLLTHTPDPPKKEAMYRKVGGEALLSFARQVPVPLSTFSSAVVAMGFTRERGVNAYLMGEWSRDGWWYYYFVAFLVKETLPFLLLCLLSLLFIRKLGLDRVTTWVLTVPVAVLFAVTLRDKAQAGIRYFLPVFPLLFVLCGVMAGRCWRGQKAGKWLIGGLLLWQAAEAVAVFPDYLAYFNQLAGGPPNGYKYLRDSNVDWGQDLKGVGRLAAREGYPEVAIYSNGIEDPSYYKIPYRRFFASEYETPGRAVYAIGAHFLDGVAWTARIKPTHVVGHSFFIYDLRQPIDDQQNRHV